MGVEHVLKKILGEENVTLVSDIQTYTDSVGKRLYPDKNQLNYLSRLDVDFIVLAGPVLSKYFLRLWRDTLIALEERGVRCILLSAGMMKMTDEAMAECRAFFSEHPPFILCTRDKETYEAFGRYALHSYNGICFSFFVPDCYNPCPLNGNQYIVLNFDKISEPEIIPNAPDGFEFNGIHYGVRSTGALTKVARKTDRFSDALVYAQSFLPQKTRPDRIGDYSIFRTDHRFHPHYRGKIYAQANSFCADLPYGYLNIYANSSLTLSDRVHACAVTLAYGHPAMFFSKTNRVGLLERVGAAEISLHPVTLDLEHLNTEKRAMTEWLKTVLTEAGT